MNQLSDLMVVIEWRCKRGGGEGREMKPWNLMFCCPNAKCCKFHLLELIYYYSVRYLHTKSPLGCFYSSPTPLFFKCSVRDPTSTLHTKTSPSCLYTPLVQLCCTIGAWLNTAVYTGWWQKRLTRHLHIDR